MGELKKLNPYEELEISTAASDAEIKAAYRALARKYHPDLESDPIKKEAAEARFKRINEAYSILSDPEKRQQYDLGEDGGGFSPHFDWSGTIFQEMNFTGEKVRPKTQHPQDGTSILLKETISFEDAYSGCSRVKTVQRVVRCPECGGSGRTSMMNCSHCGGTGEKKVTTKLNINFPPGVTDGKIFTLVGKGNQGKFGGSDGNLEIEVSVGSHPKFTIKNGDLYTSVVVNLGTAVLGGEVSVPGVRTNLTINVQPGVQNGAVFRIRNQGWPHENGQGFSDLYVTVAIEIPKELTRGQRQAFKEFVTAMGW